MSGPSRLTPDEIRTLKRLRTLERLWPKSLWLFATGDELHVMKCDEYGQRAFTERSLLAYPGVDPLYRVETFKIPSDGGDW